MAQTSEGNVIAPLSIGVCCVCLHIPAERKTLSYSGAPSTPKSHRTFPSTWLSSNMRSLCSAHIIKMRFISVATLLSKWVSDIFMTFCFLKWPKLKIPTLQNTAVPIPLAAAEQWRDVNLIDIHRLNYTILISKAKRFKQHRLASNG